MEKQYSHGPYGRDKAEGSGCLKWTVLGCLGTLLLLGGTLSILIWQFSPLYEFNMETGDLKLMGGKIQFKLPQERVEVVFDSGSRSQKKLSKFSEEVPEDFSLSLEFKESARLSFAYEEGRTFSYQCSSEPEKRGNSLYFGRDIICDFKLPKMKKVKITGGEGELSFENIHSSLHLSLTRGNVFFSPQKGGKYSYQLSTGRGHIDLFEHSGEGMAYEVFMDLGEGDIRKGPGSPQKSK